MSSRVTVFVAMLSLACVDSTLAQQKPAAGNRPNILVIWGDDIGWQNVSAYGMGTMG
jgi:hypothetical protein